MRRGQRLVRGDGDVRHHVLQAHGGPEVDEQRPVGEALTALLAGQPEGEGARHTVLVTMVRAAASAG